MAAATIGLIMFILPSARSAGNQRRLWSSAPGTPNGRHFTPLRRTRSVNHTSQRLPDEYGCVGNGAFLRLIARPGPH